VRARFCEVFGPDTVSYLVFNGTAANVVSAAGVVDAYQAVVCAATSHIHFDECGAIERFAGCRVLVVEAVDGKLDPACLERVPEGHAEPHQSKPHLLSITQATELGTVYTPDEVRSLADAAHERGWLLHMDGARLANAAAALDVSLRATTVDAGVDLLSFGGTKCGLLLGEAVLYFDPALATRLAYVHKQGLQLASKMRFLSAQFLALLDGDLWQQIGAHANAMARRLHDAVKDIPGVTISRPTQASAVFARVPVERLEALQRLARFAVWDEPIGEVRWMASWDTTAEDVDRFAARLRQALG
jgi:threonine aldolase